jgi:hypothetical protein
MSAGKLTKAQWELLALVASCPGGKMATWDGPECPLDRFCDADAVTDTYNETIDAGLLSYTHDSDSDSGTTWITEAGRKALEAGRG